jgi:predicted nucleotidyltransferase
MFDAKYKYYRIGAKEKAKLIEELRRTLEEEGVSLAILFGSFIELSSYRDIDVAVYMGEADLKTIARLSAKLEGKLGAPVDIVPIDDMPTGFRYHVLTKGLLILEK